MSMSLNLLYSEAALVGSKASVVCAAVPRWVWLDSAVMGKSRKVSAKAKAAATKKADSRAEKVKNAQKRSIQAASSKALDDLNGMLADRPQVTQHVLSLMELNAFDTVEAQDKDKLPPSCNKFSLVSKAVMIELVGQQIPALLEWLQALPKKSSKRDVMQILCYICHVSEESALPSKHKSVLKDWCADRFGSRLQKTVRGEPAHRRHRACGRVGRAAGESGVLVLGERLRHG